MYKSVVEGKGGIVVRVVAASISPSGKRIVTIEAEYPRFIHSELMTHRVFSRNAMSSRAVPISKMIEQVRNNPAMPIHWGKNQAGMQANEELQGIDKSTSEYFWREAAKEAANSAETLSSYDLHKQVVNRILEPFQMMKTVITATEWNNFFWLRCHEDSQPEIRELAECVQKALQECKYEELRPGEWHTPYVGHMNGPRNECWYYIDDGHGGDILLELEDALKVSSSCCAQVSYRVLDNSVDKAIMIYDKLVESEPVHSSPFEHQASPIGESCYEGVTHIDEHDKAWSGNFEGYIQHRQLIENNVKRG